MGKENEALLPGEEWVYTLFGRQKRKRQLQKMKVNKDRVLGTLAKVFRVVANQYFINAALAFTVEMNKFIAEKHALYKLNSRGERELNRPIVQVMSALAAVDYDEVEIEGDADFKCEVWFQLSRQGVRVIGYEPDTYDLGRLSKSDPAELHSVVQKQLEAFQIQLAKIKKSMDRKAEEDVLRAQGINPKYYPPESVSGVRKAIQNFRGEDTGSLGDGSIQAQMIKHAGMLKDLPIKKAHKPVFKVDEIPKPPMPF